jgi:hypothetical protein
MNMNKQHVKYTSDQQHKHEEMKRLIEKSRAPASEVEKVLEKIIQDYKPALKELANR